jgi:hypothetical protein
MPRSFAATLVITATALTMLGCPPPRHRHYGDRYDRNDRQRTERYDDDRYRDHDHDRSSGRLDLNRASVRELDRLPGLSGPDAERIAAYRPYERANDLVDRRIVSARKFARIKDHVYVGRGRHDDRDYDRDDRRRPERHYDRDDDRYQDRRFFDDR